MFHSLKKRLYFAGASYFRFWARFKLRRWAPRVIVITGSAGKTTLLHLVEAQLGTNAHYSHHANSAYGIPFDILGLKGVQRSRLDWVGLFFRAPFRLFSKTYSQNLYVAEVDADRPTEAQFLAALLKPQVTLWVSSLHTHAAQFDALVQTGTFKSPEEAVAHEYGHLLAATSELVVINGDSEVMRSQTKRTRAHVMPVNMKDLHQYKLATDTTSFSFANKHYTVPALLPKATYYQIAMTDVLMDFLDKEPDWEYADFHLPPGRSNVFEGIKQTTLIDSTYNNSNIDSLAGIVELFEDYPAKEKWLVVGDLLEQGKDEAREHEKIAIILNKTAVKRILLVGKRVAEHTLPAISESTQAKTVVELFDNPRDLRDYLKKELSGGETILFKGVGYLEGVIEALLAHKADAAKLPRREPMQTRRRAAWGL